MSTPHSEKHIEHIRKAGIRKGFFSEEQYSEAFIASRTHPQLSFLKFLELTGILTEAQANELESYLQNYEDILSKLPLLPEESEEEYLSESEAMLLSPIEEEEDWGDDSEMDILEAPTSSSLSAMVLTPEQETQFVQNPAWLSGAKKGELQEAPMLLPEPESLPSFAELVQQTVSIPIEKKFQFEEEEDRSFANYTIEKNLLSRETIEVLLEMQRSLKKMFISFPLAQLVYELKYIEETPILQIQTHLKVKKTLLKNYQLSKPESQFVASRPHFFASAEILRETKKVQDYFARLGIEKTLAETLFIQGNYQKGDFQKTQKSRVSSVRKSSSLGSASRVSSASRRPSRAMQNMRKKRF